MVQSVDEKRGYQRGYSRAGARYWDRLRRIIDIARGYQRRLTDLDTSRTCSTCERWTRGGSHRINESACHWGSCRADFEWGIEPRMWADLPIGAPKNLHAEIITQPDFCCVSWLPKEATIKGGRHDGARTVELHGGYKRSAAEWASENRSSEPRPPETENATP